MPPTSGIEIRGLDELRLRFNDPKPVREATKKFFRQGVNLARKDVRARIPRGRTRRGRRSVRAKIDLKQLVARVFSPLYYVRFLAKGTKRGISAQHMFTKSAEAIEPAVLELANEAMEEIAAGLRGG